MTGQAAAVQWTPRRIGVRAVVVAGIYLVTALAVAGVIFAMRRVGAPSLLQSVLSVFLIASLSAGLEPGTVKAEVLGGGLGRLRATALAPLLITGALKGLVASVPLALVWRVADPKLAPTVLAWTPLMTVAGFVATELRALFDVEGRYALAIGLKQGSLAGGLALLAALMMAGVPLFWAVGLSSVARLVFASAFAWSARRGTSGGLRVHIGRLLRDPRWLELAGASAIAATGGSMDRILGLRLLPADQYNAYFLAYEVLCRFWLITYLINPILFARLAARQSVAAFIRVAQFFVVVAGTLLVAALALAVAFAPALVDRLVGAQFGWGLVALALAVVITAFVQLRMAELQGGGATRRAALLTGACVAITAGVFLVMIHAFGARGLLWGWLIKATLELAAVTLLANVGRESRL
jgi:hypothetical protein